MSFNSFKNGAMTLKYLNSHGCEFWLRAETERPWEWTVQDYGGDDGHSMARTTGLVTAICTEAWIDDSEMLPAGAHAPEVLSDRVLSRVVREMIAHGVEITGPRI